MAERIEELRANLENIGRDLTHLASLDKLGPIYERKDIISQIASLLSNKENSILLVGEPGTGKNAVVEGLARWMARKEVDLPYKKIIECNQSRFQAFCLYAHELETKTELIVEELRKNDAILFF